MTKIKNWLRSAWLWMTADWKRLLILPAIAAGVIAVARLARGRVVPSSPVSGPVLSPKQGAAEHEAIDADLAAKESATDAEAEAIKARLAAKYGGKP